MRSERGEFYPAIPDFYPAILVFIRQFLKNGRFTEKKSALAYTQKKFADNYPAIRCIIGKNKIK
ncbi:MAG TPA: hypothetical protein DDZ11_00200 [Lentisphaeria bacterium]|nr:hypothetical protein [Lentisphaeria bacterium]